MVGRLPRRRRPLRRVGDDRIGRLIDHDADAAYGVEIAHQPRLVREEIHQRLERAGRLVLVEPELEVHRVDGEGVGLDAQFEVERALAIRAALVEPVDGERIAKDILRADEPRQRPAGAHHGGFRRQGGRGPLGIGELMAGPDGPEGHVVGHGHADRRLDLGFAPAERRGISRRAGHGTVVDVVDRVLPQREDLRQPAADLVDEQHEPEGGIAVEPRFTSGGDRDGIVVVVAELAGDPPLGGVVAKVRAVGIPFPDGGGVGGDRLFDRAEPPRAEAEAAP